MKKAIVLSASLLFFALGTWAQVGNGISNLFQPLKGIPIEVTPRGGITAPVGNIKNQSFLGNGQTGGLDISFSFRNKKRGAKVFGIDLGLDLSGDYSSFTANGGLDDVRNLYKRSDGVMEPGLDNAGIKAKVLQFAAGPRLTFFFKKLNISPAFQLGYLDFRRNGYTILDTLQQGSQVTTIPLLVAKENRTSGLLLKPRIELGYDLSRSIRLSIGSSFNYGPAIRDEFLRWQPDVTQTNNTYTSDQLAAGKPVVEQTSTRFQSVAYEFGFKMGLGTKPLRSAIKAPKNPIPKANALVQKNKAGKTEIKANSDGATVPATAPQIIYPENGKTTALINGALQLNYRKSSTDKVAYEVTIWEVDNGGQQEVFKNVFDHSWNGIIPDFRTYSDVDKKKGTKSYQAQIKAMPCNNCDTGKKSDIIPGDYHTIQSNGTPVFDNGGLSDMVGFNISGSCFPEMSISLDSARCIDSNKSKVWGHLVLNNTAGMTVNSVTITDFKENNFSGPAVTVSNLVPGYSLPPVNNSNYSFHVDKNMCNKILFMRVLVTYTCALTGETVTVPCADTISMPCCSCNYCADSMKIASLNSAMQDAGNNMAQVQQSFSVTPNNITSIKAEIVYLSDSVNDDVCRICDKQPLSVYHFTGSNTASWNGGANLNASASNSTQTFPAKGIVWQSNNQGSVSFNLNIDLPDLPDLECCTMTNKICIRYTFTDVNCKTCDVLICYSLTRNAQKTRTAAK